MAHGIENFFSYDGAGNYSGLNDKKKYKERGHKNNYSCCFFNGRIYREKIFDPIDSCKDELEKLKIKHDKLTKEKDDFVLKYENLLKSNEKYG